MVGPASRPGASSRRTRRIATLRSTLCPMRKVALPVPFILIGLAVWTLTGGAADADRDWPAYAGDRGSAKCSPLEQINKDTIKNLRVAWTRSGLPEELSPTFPHAQAAAKYQHTPLVVGGVMYMSSA